jgi:membrane protein insertase Oxa1/YidC/SpoIIIJ
MLIFIISCLQVYFMCVNDADFYNTLIIDLLNYICVNGTLHIMQTIVINGFVKKKTGD